MLSLTVFVTSWKRPHLLRDTLATILSKLDGLKSRVVVVDNESSAETRAVINSFPVECWPLGDNRGINWPIENLLAPTLDTEYVCISDQDIHYAEPFVTYLEFLRDNPDISYAKGLDAPEHRACGAREYWGEWWLIKECERGGGVVMKSDTLRAAFPLRDHVVDFDWRLCEVGGLWAILPATMIHTGWQQSTREGVTGTPEKHILVDGVIVENPNVGAF